MDSWAKLAWTNMDNGQRDECKAYIVEVFNEGSAAHFAFLDQISMVEVGACTPQEAYEELSKFFDGKENLMSLLKVILGLKRHTQDGSTSKEDLRKSPAEVDEPAKGNDHTQDGSTNKEDLRKSPAGPTQEGGDDSSQDGTPPVTEAEEDSSQDEKSLLNSQNEEQVEAEKSYDGHSSSSDDEDVNLEKLELTKDDREIVCQGQDEEHGNDHDHRNGESSNNDDQENGNDDDDSDSSNGESNNEDDDDDSDSSNGESNNEDDDDDDAKPEDRKPVRMLSLLFSNNKAAFLTLCVCYLV